MIQNSTPWYIFRENKNSNSKKYLDPNVQSTISDNCQDTEVIQGPINRGMGRADGRMHAAGSC